MRSLLLVGVLPLVHGVRIIQSNDDGWAESNVRTLFNTLADAGHDMILSGPAEQNSGRSSLDAPPKKVDGDGCIYRSCPPNSPPTGANETDPRLNYVNSYPVTSIKIGIDTTAPKLWDGKKPELAVTGPNVGSNVGIQVPFSGTVGAAVHAVKNARIPAIAFSGKSANHAAWNEEPPLSAKIYAELALNVTTTVLESGTPYLPAGVWLNVNFPEVSDRRCNDPKQFKYVLSRINKAGFLSSDDVEWCGSERLPEESDVVKEEGCYASISVGDANDKTTADGERQAEVLEKLKPILSCLPIRDD